MKIRREKFGRVVVVIKMLDFSLTFNIIFAAVAGALFLLFLVLAIVFLVKGKRLAKAGDIVLAIFNALLFLAAILLLVVVLFPSQLFFRQIVAIVPQLTTYLYSLWLAWVIIGAIAFAILFCFICHLAMLTKNPEKVKTKNNSKPSNNIAPTHPDAVVDYRNIEEYDKSEELPQHQDDKNIAITAKKGDEFTKEFIENVESDNDWIETPIPYGEATQQRMIEVERLMNNLNGDFNNEDIVITEKESQLDLEKPQEQYQKYKPQQQQEELQQDPQEEYTIEPYSDLPSTYEAQLAEQIFSDVRSFTETTEKAQEQNQPQEIPFTYSRREERPQEPEEDEKDYDILKEEDFAANDEFLFDDFEELEEPQEEQPLQKEQPFVGAARSRALPVKQKQIAKKSQPKVQPKPQQLASQPGYTAQSSKYPEIKMRSINKSDYGTLRQNLLEIADKANSAKLSTAKPQVAQMPIKNTTTKKPAAKKATTSTAAKKTTATKKSTKPTTAKKPTATVAASTTAPKKPTTATASQTAGKKTSTSSATLFTTKKTTTKKSSLSSQVANSQTANTTKGDSVLKTSKYTIIDKKSACNAFSDYIKKN